MEVKKSPEADLQNKKGLFLQIGLVAVLCAAIAIFSYSQGKKSAAPVVTGPGNVDDPEIIDPTRQDEPQPQPVKMVVPIVEIINIVKNDSLVSGFPDNLFVDPEGDVIIEIKPIDPPAIDNDIFFKVEQMPQFQGGDLASFRNWVMGKLKYPPVAAANGISGRVTLQFVIEKDGTLGEIVVVTSPDKSLSDEAVRVLNTSPKWTPGQQGRQKVRVKYTLPVDFRIQQ